MKNLKLFCLFALIAACPAAAWSQVGAVQNPDSCIVNPSAIAMPRVHPARKYVHLHTTPQTKARAHALAALRRHKAGQLAVSINICPPTRPMTCRDTLGASANLTGPQVETMLVAAGYNGNPGTLTLAMMRAMQQHPEAAPALYAYALQHVNPADQAGIAQLSQAAYQAAPGKAAALAYGGTLSNPGESIQITQSLMAGATPAEKNAILACSIAPEIKTGAFVPSLAQPELSSVGQNDIRNSVNNGVGVVTLVPGLEAREKDDSAT